MYTQFTTRIKIAAVVVFFAGLSAAMAQSARIQRINPTNWWVGMKNPNLQLLIYGPNAGSLTYTINYAGVKLVKAHTVENSNYAFLDLTIAPTAKAGTLTIVGKRGGQTLTQPFELKARDRSPKGQGVTAADFIYLIMPDRFANGDPANDKFPDMLDTQADTKNPYLRHGGDFKGIINHLDYLKDLGVTALWLTPVIDNDETLKKEGPDRNQAGYHGYHFTDHYQIDKRFGGIAGYIELASALHKRGMKLVQDAVYNHISDDHWFFKDKPMKDWVNVWPTYTGSTHKEQSLYDPHGSAADKKTLLDGWFTPFLPDLNQRNPYVANFLIQHAIWSTEMFSLDAWRIDTYKYNDLDFLNRCNKALMDEYPKIHLFGESVVNNPVGQAFFVKNTVGFPFKSNQPGALDFVLYNAFNDALNQRFDWDSGVNRIHQVLAQDDVYADPNKLVTFLENHDTDRYLSVIGEDFDKYKLGVTWLLTTRGIPHWYYGTEILMKGTKNPSDAEVRKDFPGGFSGDKENKFESAGRTDRENEAVQFVRKLATYRRNNPVLQSGKLTQFVPQEGTYVYFRHDATKTVMIASNTGDKEISLDTSRFAERMNGFTSARNVQTDALFTDLKMIKLPAKSALVLELIK
ncbi:glycoside hydrolase family 13 protein [Spirosoma sp.]|uniref:glycoside hydrolase family 13 protein n=1 Tax=Spirosoma sp. TaxID=1899569 RepID=UPI00260F2D42|nr:glycoside hydrolase family 13 protein [Spirosoma sp.]MCX6215523.1 glycoside hydrolase family 13 protein [Spirosoma sp.]